MSRNFRLSCLVTMVTMLLGSHLSLSSARHTDKSSRQQSSRISKRDVYMGAAMHCRLHPRNCVDAMEWPEPRRVVNTRPNLMDKRGLSLVEKLRRLYPNAAYKTSEGSVDRQDSPPSVEDSEFETVGTYPRDETLVKQLLEYLTSDSLQGYRPKTW